MIQFFHIRLNKKEKRFLFVYCLLVFVSGVFLSSFDIIIHSKFFEFMGYKYLAISYILSGVLGTIFIYVYSFLYKKINTKTFFFITITFLVIVSSIFYTGYILNYNQYIYFAGMVLFFPVNTLMLLVLWRFGRKLLPASKTRIVFPWLKFSMLFGLVSGSGLIIALISFLGLHSAIMTSFYVLLLIWPLHIMLVIVHKKTGLIVKKHERFIPVKRNLFFLFTSKFTARLFLFTILSAIVGISIHFTFFNISWVAFRNVLGMGKFYALFSLVLSVFIFGVDKYLVKRILYSYDSPYSLVLVPALLLLSMLFVFAGDFFAGIRQQFMDHFSIFFLLIAILKVSYVTAYQTIQVPSLRTLFHALDLRYRQFAYPSFEGTVLMMGMVFAGLLILALTYLKFFSLTIVILFSLLTGIFWLWTGIKLLKTYREELQHEITRFRFGKRADERDNKFEEHLSEVISGNDEEKIITAMNISKIFEPLVYENNLIRLLAHPSQRIKEYVLENIVKEGVDEALPELKKRIPVSANPVEVKFRTTIHELENNLSLTATSEEISDNIYALDDNTRSNLLKAIINSDVEGKEGFLVSLTKDTNTKIQNRAIKTLAQLGEKSFNYSLLEFLYPENYNPYAFEAIASKKDLAISYLEREELLPGTDNLVLSRIIRLYGKIGTTKAIEKLLKNLDKTDSFLMNQSIEALFENRFQASSGDKFKILGFFVKQMALLTRNLNIHIILRKYKKASLLSEAYLLESENIMQNLFRLLSLIYNQNFVFSLQRMFLNGSRAEINHAIELTDEHIDEDIKPLFLTLVEDITLNEKLKRLEYYFPQRKSNLEEIISSSITQDFNSLTIYTRICALVLIDYLDIPGYYDELIFCASHPDTILSEAAHYILERRKVKAEKGKSKRKSRLSIEKFLTSESYPSLLFYKYYELNKIEAFQLLNSHICSELTKAAWEFPLSAGEMLDLTAISSEFSLLLTSSVIVDENDIINIEFSNHFISLELLYRKGIHKLYIKNNGTVWAFKKQAVGDLLYDNIELANAILYSIENLKFRKTDEQSS